MSNAALRGPLARLFRHAGPAVASVSTLILGWEAYVQFSGISSTALPAPSRILAQGFVQREALARHSLATLQATTFGFASSLTAAFLFSILIDFFQPLRRALFPVFIITQTLPLVAIAPLIVLWFGFGLTPKIVLVALVTFFPMLVALAQGYEATDRNISALLASMGASRWRIFVMARLPSALPYFFAGLRISITYAVVGAIFAEYAGAARGLGIYILNAKNNFRPDLVLAAVFVSATLTLVLFGATVLLQHVAMPWLRLEGAPPMSNARLDLKSLRKSFGPTHVLADISLSVQPGEFVAILGPSGAGKSTILQLLTGAATPDAGHMLLDGQPLTPSQHRFAFMPQGDALMPWRRIIDNTTLGLEVQGLSRQAARARVGPLFSDFGLSGFENHYPAQLSGGMRQRAALLRTVVQQRPMLLLDEPFGALDALTRAQMQRWLATMWTRHRWTVLLITHDVREAVLLSDRIYVLSPRPARVAHEFQVPLDHPRHSVGSPALAAIEAEIMQTLLNPED